MFAGLRLGEHGAAAALRSQSRDSWEMRLDVSGALQARALHFIGNENSRSM